MNNDQSNFLRLTIRNLSLIDVCVLLFLLYFNLRLLWAPSHPDVQFAQPIFLGSFFLFILTTVLCRGAVLTTPRSRGITHRFSLLINVLGLYLLAMRKGLSALQPTLVDEQLNQVDVMLFGVSPAQSFEYFATPITTEWFAFFYFSYFLIVGLTVLPCAFFGRSDFSRALVTGSVFIVCLGHILYTLVPGRGPYIALSFDHPLSGGFFWETVNQMVVAQGALLDIFPSLHTALPVFITLCIFHHRSRWRQSIYWWCSWMTLVMFTLNIMIATMFLRWHYAADVIAGLVLACLTQWIVKRYNPSDNQRYEQGKQAIFEPCLGK